MVDEDLYGDEEDRQGPPRQMVAPIHLLWTNRMIQRAADVTLTHSHTHTHTHTRTHSHTWTWVTCCELRCALVTRTVGFVSLFLGKSLFFCSFMQMSRVSRWMVSTMAMMIQETSMMTGDVSRQRPLRYVALSVGQWVGVNQFIHSLAKAQKRKKRRLLERLHVGRRWTGTVQHKPIKSWSIISQFWWWLVLIGADGSLTCSWLAVKTRHKNKCRRWCRWCAQWRPPHHQRPADDT